MNEGDQAARDSSGITSREDKMSKEAITKVVQRAISDAAFRRQLSTDPTGALRGFDLSAEESAAIRAGDAGRLSAMGVDQRMSKSFALGGASVGASRAAGSDLANASSAMASDPAATASARDNALVSDNLSESDALISDGVSSRAGIIPTEPHIRTADADGAVASASRAINDDPDGYLAAADARASGGDDAARSARINDDPDGFLAANADTGAAARTARVGDDWKYSTSAEGNAAPIEGSPEAAAADLAKGGGMAAYPAHGGLAGPSQVGADSTARANTINDDPDGFLAANAKADVSGSSAGETAFADESEAYLPKVGYDAGVSARAVTDTHDRGGGVAASASDGGNAPGGETAYIDDSESYLSSINTDDSGTAVTDAHDRGGDDIVTRVDEGDDTGASAASEDGPNISS